MNDAQRQSTDALLRRLHESVGIFAGMDRDDMIHLLAGASRAHFKAGDCVFSEGETGEAMYVVVSGRLFVSRRRADGSPLVLATIEAGEAIGELALLDDAPRSATVRALDSCEVLVIHRKAIRERSSLAAVLYHNLARVLAHRLRVTNEDLLSRPFHPSSQAEPSA